MFQTEGGILQAFGQGNVVVHSSAVVVKDKIRQAVDVAGAGKEKLVGIGCGVRCRVVEVMVPCIPLGARNCLELVCPEADEMTRLVPIPRVTTVSKVFILKCQPGLVKEAVEERGTPESLLRMDQVSVWLGECREVKTDGRIIERKDGSKNLS
jgi:hypothetical protein